MADHPPMETRVYLAYLRRVRQSVINTTEGLDEEALRRPGVPSGTSLLGLVHHLTGVEEHWFQKVFLGEPGQADKSMTPPADRSPAKLVRAYRDACARSDEIALSYTDPAMLAAVPNPGEEQRDQLRVILAHMLEETARHSGHADILREQVDGVTGL